MKYNNPAATFTNTLQSSLNALKGLLIIFVVMDHNDLLRILAPDLFRPLTFHVLGFLVLPCLLPTKPVDRGFFLDRLIRYLVPFWWVLTFTTLMYALAFRNGGGLSTVAVDWLAAAAIGSAPLVKTATGFYYLWFLPCLAGMVILLTLFQSLNKSWQYASGIVMLLGHAVITAFPEVLLRYTPFGLLIVMWVFPLGLLMRWAITNGWVFRLRYLILVVFLASYSYLVAIGLNVEIMTLELRSISEPLLFLLQDITAVSGVLMVMWIATKLDKLSMLNLCGKHSLMVYLLHPLVFFLGYKLSGVSNLHLESYPLLAVGVLSVVLTVSISLLLAIGIARIPIARAWLTPKDWKDWGPVRLLSRA